MERILVAFLTIVVLLTIGAYYVVNYTIPTIIVNTINTTLESRGVEFEPLEWPPNDGANKSPVKNLKTINEENK